ncbi:hypothetical protein CNMCM5793_006458 [Aspergillus hiratsukae]|uniref:Uncharacterized protein n=1 Tax=Aspergillus hiratsukae TaxID=1194566 RepID=A0A8H6UCR5_9EURO|nr:hypothetical protein CNMCM5793_006458 [Aspergillus hiratsukae]KAF7160231.1 hypothetical protein CNMCM6106_007667 [Aspergillus hiratsukae]
MKMNMFASFHQPLAGCDYRALQFFHFQTVSCFGGKAGDFLLRAAYYDPTVRVAATALGSLHRAFRYSSAIHLALNQIPVTEIQSTDSILIMCVLFFCFESLQGQFRNAVKHGIAGLRILQQREERFLNEGSVARLPPSIVCLMFVTIENQMLEVDWKSYLPVSIQSTLLSPSKLPPVNLDDTPTLDQLADSFQFFYNQYLKFLYLSQTPESAELARTLHKNQAYYGQMGQHMHAWSEKFDAFLESHVQTHLNETDRTTIAHLKMWRKMMGVFLQMDAPPNQGGLDRFCSEFAAILCITEDLMDFSCTNPKDARPSATQEYPSANPPQARIIIIITFPVVLLLRRLIRHRAIDLMSRSRRREGVWDSVVFSTLARKMVAIEEEAAEFAPEAVYEPVDLRLSARTNVVAGEFCEGRRGKIEFFRDGVTLREEVIQW